MTMTGGALAPLLTISPDKETSLAPPDDDPGMAMRPARADARPPNSDSCTAPTATIRHALRALASESGPGKGLNQVRLLRPLVAQAHDILRERFESGGSAEEYLRGRTRLADSVVIHLLHIESISSGMRNGSMVAPLAAIAAGGYGRRELAPAPTSTCSSSSLKAAPERSRRQRERASAPWLPPSGILASRRGMLEGRGRQRSVAHASPCIARCVCLGGRARREARPRWSQRLAARALGQRLRLGALHAAQAVPACPGAPFPVAGAVSFALARRSGRRPSQQVAATRHRTPAWPHGLARTGCASAARYLSIPHPQYRRCERIRTAIAGKAAPKQSLKPE